MPLKAMIKKPVYTVNLNNMHLKDEIFREMKALSITEAPVLNEGIWAGIYRIVSTELGEVAKQGLFISDAPFVYDDAEIHELNIPTGYAVIGVMNKKEEFVGIIEANDLQQEVHNLYVEAVDRNRQMDAIIDNAYDGIFIADKIGYVTRVNRAMCRLSGMNKESFLGVHLTELVRRGTFKHQSISWRSLQERREISGIQRYPTGQEHLVSASPISDEFGNIQGVVSTVRDITELSQLREQLAEIQDQSEQYKSELSILRKRIQSEEIVAVSPQMKSILDLVERVANFDSTVLILGESGVGKEVIASLIHKASARSQGPFIKINCGAIPTELLESELFGYESGAFTGAKKAGKIGLFEAAEGGVVFLDEIGEMSPALQVKILRVLQEQEFTRVGGIQSIQVNCRIVAATHRNLQEHIQKGLFREDLYYRLYVVPIHIPPLRERKEDIPALLQYFLNKYNKKYGTERTFDPAVVQILQNHCWPGNVRQLSNLVERMVVTIPENAIGEHHLPEDYFQSHQKTMATFTEGVHQLADPNAILNDSTASEMGQPGFNAFDEMERNLIVESLSRYGSIRKVGQALGVSHTTVIKKMRKFGIERNR
ncbi:sigma 54-interacting transcriptional regulator [Aneurinibacillus sp. Ricciae_BoGa-3]|uniref:sigma-54 interaction domain-containing protein n=1 Tax=Aneurinibacillus sp. Ricciae_BoGa-3 TaxID=3022697 RepID=UPI00234097E1|nr:sigma 54-interacting transcriptional regulator [Aneurinibacillus sp. Ricciae_BoGa-3]WCK52583.1 sigma 54-interacting transcriptional regulator [Aneurinibacillus sp. Ricciae_BoGa-3]